MLGCLVACWLLGGWVGLVGEWVGGFQCGSACLDDSGSTSIPHVEHVHTCRMSLYVSVCTRKTMMLPSLLRSATSTHLLFSPSPSPSPPFSPLPFAVVSLTSACVQGSQQKPKEGGVFVVLPPGAYHLAFVYETSAHQQQTSPWCVCTRR